MTNNDNKYGHLLDRYMDGAPVDYATKKEREEEARGRYGHLLDYAKPNYSTLETIVKIDECGRERRRREAEKEERANQRRQERIEQEKRERQERSAFVESMIAKSEAEREAKRRVEEEKRKKAESEQNFLNNIQRLIDMHDETEAMVAQTGRMLKADEERRKAHEENMAWYKGQEKVNK